MFQALRQLAAIPLAVASLLLRIGLPRTAGLLVLMATDDERLTDMILREFRDADKDPGIWREIANDENRKLPPEERAQLLVRGIPKTKEQEFRKKFDVTLTMKVKRQEIDLDTEGQGAKLIARCVFAWRDAKNLQVWIGDEKVAAAYKPFFPEADVDTAVTLDGRIGSEQVREMVLTHHPALLNDISEGIDALAVQKIVVAEAASKN